MDRLRTLLDSPAFVLAENDSAFLHRDDLRGARLQLEYLKPELTLQERGIRSTIVLFGGTHIVEREIAQKRCDEMAARLAEQPGDPELARAATVAARILDKSRYYDVAREFAYEMASWTKQSGREGEYVVTTGGGPGIMEAGNRGAFEAGAPTVGLNISLPLEQLPNPYITPELCLNFRYFALRKMHFIQRAKALVAFPGGYGTLDEIFDALCLVQTQRIPPIPIVLVSRDFWCRVLDAEFLAAEGVIAPEDVDLIHYAETAGEICAFIRSWWGEES